MTAADGEVVNVYVQDELLATDPASAQRWADMLVSLVHGPEISNLDGLRRHPRHGHAARAAPARSAATRTTASIGIGQDLRGITARAVLTHEYGHHVANNRDNAPWKAVD